MDRSNGRRHWHSPGAAASHRLSSLSPFRSLPVALFLVSPSLRPARRTSPPRACDARVPSVMVGHAQHVPHHRRLLVPRASSTENERERHPPRASHAAGNNHDTTRHHADSSHSVKASSKARASSGHSSSASARAAPTPTSADLPISQPTPVVASPVPAATDPASDAAASSTARVVNPSGKPPQLTQSQTWAIIASAAAVGVIMIGMLVWWWCRRRAAKKAEESWWGVAASGRKSKKGGHLRLADEKDGPFLGESQEMSPLEKPVSPFGPRSFDNGSRETSPFNDYAAAPPSANQFNQSGLPSPSLLSPNMAVRPPLSRTPSRPRRPSEAPPLALGVPTSRSPSPSSPSGPSRERLPQTESPTRSGQAGSKKDTLMVYKASVTRYQSSSRLAFRHLPTLMVATMTTQLASTLPRRAATRLQTVRRYPAR
jgi:hypothetical protein